MSRYIGPTPNRRTVCEPRSYVKPGTPPKKASGLVAIVGALAASVLFVTIPEDEGVKYKAYKDIAGIWTICMGDTQNVRPGQVASEAECQERLEKQLIAHAEPVVKCTPNLSKTGNDYRLAAAVSLAYNIGPSAYCRSTVDRRFDAGDYTGACDAFLMWNKARVNGTLRPVRGLTLRRQREREICLRNAM